jgi:hypothetical protein
LKKSLFSFFVFLGEGVIHHELWISCVATSNLSNTMDANQNSGKEPFSENSVHFENYLSHQPFQLRSATLDGRNYLNMRGPLLLVHYFYTLMVPI